MDEATKKEVEALIAGAIKTSTDQLMAHVAEATKPLAGLTQTVEDLGKNVGIVSDTLAKLPPAAAGQASTEDVSKLVNDGIAKALSDRDAASAASARKAAVRKKIIDAHLPGVDESFIALPDSDDEAVLTEAAKALRTKIEGSFKTKLADVGGVAKDGGTPVVPSPEKTGFLQMPSGATAPKA